MDLRHTLILSAAAMSLGIGESDGVRIVRPLRSSMPEPTIHIPVTMKRGGVKAHHPRLIKRGPSGRHPRRNRACAEKLGSLSLSKASTPEKRAKRARRITRLHKTSRR